MQIAEFQAWVRERWSRNPRPVDLAVMTLGLCGEAGEVSEPIKKLIRGTHPDLDLDALALELGDVLHYLTAIANHFKIDLEEIIEMNVDKLTHRDHRYSDHKGS